MNFRAVLVKPKTTYFLWFRYWCNECWFYHCNAVFLDLRCVFPVKPFGNCGDITMEGTCINLRCGVASFCLFTKAGHEKSPYVLVFRCSDIGGQGRDAVGAGGMLGAQDGRKASRTGDNFRSLIRPKIEVFRPRFLERRSVMIWASCFSL